MIVEWTKYKRFFTFGCSFTSYMWPTWADILAKEMPDAEFYNFGVSGGGNPLISYRVAEANNRFKFTDTDLVMIMFTTFCREDRWVTDKRWLAGGNVYNNRIYSEEWVKEFADEKGYLIRDAAVIDMTARYLENTKVSHNLMLSVPFVTNIDIPGHGTKEIPHEIRAVYQDTFNKFKPSMHELELRLNWKQLENDYQFRDGHPAPFRYYNYLKKLGFNLTDKSKTYANEASELLKSIPVRNIVPIYFPEQDKNISKSITLLF